MTEKKEIKKIVSLLEQGCVVLYPTDTVWGLGCDALNEKAVKRLFQIKKRMEDKSVISLIDTVERLTPFVNGITKEIENMLLNTDIPQTVILPRVFNLPSGVINQNGSAAFRIPKHHFCIELLKIFKKPLVSTSANISGEKTPFYFEEISDEIKRSVDYIVPSVFEGETTHKPSQIILVLSNGEIQSIRK